MSPFEPFVNKFGVVILDGALATELERRGADLGDPLWSAKMLIERPDMIRQLHYDYFQAGADVATTASYQATFAGFARRGLSARQAEDLLILSVRLAQEARDEFWSEQRHRVGRLRPLVAASVGCYGASLHDGCEYRGDYGLTVRQLIDFHRDRLDVLAHSGAEVLACETIPCRVEAEALVALLEHYPQLPAWLSFSCRDDRHVCHGESLVDCVASAEHTVNIVAVGVNCTPPRYISGLLKSIAGHTEKLLLAYPNSGESWDAARHCWTDTAETSDWTRLARQWHSDGARLIGGCCRTSPETIVQLAALRNTTAASWMPASNSLP
jgi:homocysteine S-methyltransferase